MRRFPSLQVAVQARVAACQFIAGDPSPVPSVATCCASRKRPRDEHCDLAASRQRTELRAHPEGPPRGARRRLPRRRRLRQALRGAAAQLEEVLVELGVEHDVKEYPDDGHSFMNRHNAGLPLSFVERVAGFDYQHPSAEDAWARIQRFFDLHLAPDTSVG